MIKLIFKYQKLEKSITVDENYIFPSYGDKVNEFNDILRVVDSSYELGVVTITLADL